MEGSCVIPILESACAAFRIPFSLPSTAIWHNIFDPPEIFMYRSIKIDPYNVSYRINNIPKNVFTDIW